MKRPRQIDIKFKAEFYVNAARDAPALFTSLKLVSSKIASARIAPSGPVSLKLTSARLALVGRNFTASYE